MYGWKHIACALPGFYDCHRSFRLVAFMHKKEKRILPRVLLLLGGGWGILGKILERAAGPRRDSCGTRLV